MVSKKGLRRARTRRQNQQGNDTSTAQFIHLFENTPMEKTLWYSERAV